MKNLLFSTLLPLLLLITSATRAQQGSEPNYFAGSAAGLNNHGDQVTGVGSGAGAYNGGNYSSFFGFQAGATNGGNFNVSIGYNTGYFNSGAYGNYVGAYAGYNTKGSFNNFFGYYSGYYNTTGSQNNFFGYYAGLNNTTGYGNAFFGHQAGTRNTGGNLNTFIGYEAGYNNTTGANNTLLGNRAGRFITTASRNTLLGNQTGENTTGADNTFVGYKTGATNTGGSNHTALGNYAGPGSATLTNTTAIGYRALVTASNSLVLGSINGVNGATANTKVGIGLTAPTHQLQLSTDDAAKPGTSTWKVASDKRLKKDIVAFKDGIQVLNKINPVWFRYTGEAGMPTDTRYVGVVAQEMQQVAPYTIGKFTHGDSTGKQTEYLDYDAGALTYILVNAVKELHLKGGHQAEKLAEKDQQIARLQEQNQQIIKELTELKALLLQQAGQVEKMLPPAARLAVPSAEAAPVAELGQNQPNPTDGTTLIPYLLPEKFTTAQLILMNLAGETIGRYPLAQSGKGQVSIPTDHFPNGVYLYQLVVDGKLIDAKKMLVQR